MRHTSGAYGSSGTGPLLAAVASRQRGLLRTRDLRALGLDSSAVRKRVLRGILHPRYPGVYTLGSTALSREGEFLAAVYAGGDGSTLGHFACGELLRVQRRRATVIDVIVPRRHRPLAGIRFHVTSGLHPRDVTIFKGIPVTTVPRLLVDLSDTQHPLELANVIHEADFDLCAARETIGRSNGRHHLHVVEQAIEYHRNGSAGFKSRDEARYFQLVQRAGLPEPLVNVDLHGLEIDCRWPEHRLAVEIDGHGHGRARTKREDAAVDLALKAAGYTVLRLTERDLDLRPEWVVQTTRRAL